MIPVRLSRRADADLDDILDYTIAEHGREVAEAYLGMIRTAVERLSSYPDLGMPRPDLGVGLRSLSTGEHRVIYRSAQDRVLIARVLHKRMDPVRWL